MNTENERKILVAGCDRDFCASIYRALTLRGLAADVVFDGVQAIRAFSASDYDIAIIDADITRVAACEVADKFRSLSGGKVLALLNDCTEISKAVNDLKCDAALTRPFTRKRFYEVIDGLL